MPGLFAENQQNLFSTTLKQCLDLKNIDNEINQAVVNQLVRNIYSSQALSELHIKLMAIIIAANFNEKKIATQNQNLDYIFCNEVTDLIKKILSQEEASKLNYWDSVYGFIQDFLAINLLNKKLDVITINPSLNFTFTYSAQPHINVRNKKRKNGLHFTSEELDTFFQLKAAEAENGNSLEMKIKFLEAQLEVKNNMICELEKKNAHLKALLNQKKSKKHHDKRIVGHAEVKKLYEPNMSNITLFNTPPELLITHSQTLIDPYRDLSQLSPCLEQQNNLINSSEWNDTTFLTTLESSKHQNHKTLNQTQAVKRSDQPLDDLENFLFSGLDNLASQNISKFNI